MWPAQNKKNGAKRVKANQWNRHHPLPALCGRPATEVVEGLRLLRRQFPNLITTCITAFSVHMQWQACRIAQSLWSTLTHRHCCVQHDQASFAATRQVVDEINQQQSSPAYLDVGGVPFHASHEALQRGGTHALAVLSRGVFSSEVGADGTVFLDRDSAWFALVLQYLRDGTAFLPRAKSERSAMLREVRFYSIQGLRAHVGPLPLPLPVTIPSNRGVPQGTALGLCFFSLDVLGPLVNRQPRR